MPDMRYYKDEGKFLQYCWDVYADYYPSFDRFRRDYETLETNERKNLFLKLTSFYKYLIRDGEYHLTSDNDSVTYIDYLDETYKFIAMMALIEDLFAHEKYLDFFQWLMMRKHRDEIFPISDIGDLEQHYRSYKDQYGASVKVQRFFEDLDDPAKEFLGGKIVIEGEYKPSQALAKLFYDIRSKFVHSAILILEFSKGGIISFRQDSMIHSSLTLGDLRLLIEDGLLQHFGLSPNTRRIK